MKCPNCDIEMNQVNAYSQYGLPIFVDQCSRCGGLWFDSNELFRIKEGTIEYMDKRIPPVDTRKLKTSVRIKEKLHCPLDDTLLELFQDPFFPRSLKVESCPSCGGFWFNRGEFNDFQEWRSAKRNAQEKANDLPELDSDIEQKINRLIEEHNNQSNYDSLANLASFLNQPVERFRLGGRTAFSQDPSGRFLYIVLSLLRGILGV